MITQQDLQEAIAECQGVRNPNASTCIKLAAFLTIQKEMYGKNEDITPHTDYSFSTGPSTSDVIQFESDTEFANLVNGRDQQEIMRIVDELITTLEVVQPRLYASVMRRIRDL